jgi:hypothetical protein
MSWPTTKTSDAGAERREHRRRTDAEVLRARLEEWVLGLLGRLAGGARGARGGLAGSLLRRLVIETRTVSERAPGRITPRDCAGADGSEL